MAQKPVHLRSDSGKPFGRQAIWDAIRQSPELFTIPALAAATDIHRDTIKSYVKGLAAAGYVGPHPKLDQVNGANAWRLVKDIGVEAPRVTRDGKPVTQGAARQQMWRTIRMLSGDWTWRDLAVMASTEATRVSEEDAKDYVGHLARAGYLITTHKGQGVGKGAIPGRYRLDPGHNTGPRPPMVQRLKTVFDANLGKVMWQEAPHDD